MTPAFRLDSSKPLEVIASQGDGPYAYRDRLGWCVVGNLAAEITDSANTPQRFL